MSDDIQNSNDAPEVIQAQEGTLVSNKTAEKSLIDELSQGNGKKYIRFIMAAIGSVPWVGSYLTILGAVAGLSGEIDQDKINFLLKLWLQEHQPKLEELKTTLNDIVNRLENLGEEIQDRLESPEFLAIVRSSIRSWDEADTAEKREYIKRLLSNAAATKLGTDDLVRLFIGWINTYHESHFAVIKQIYRQPGITRGQIWDADHSERPREDSSDADLFRYLIRDLGLGGVIRQSKEISDDGNFYRQQNKRTPRGAGNPFMESAFEDTKPYVLTELGKQFIHYVLNDVVQRVKA